MEKKFIGSTSIVNKIEKKIDSNSWNVLNECRQTRHIIGMYMRLYCKRI